MNGKSTHGEHGDMRRKAKEEERSVKQLTASLRRAAAMAARRGDEIQELIKERDHKAELLRITEDQMKLRIEERDSAREKLRKVREAKV